MSIYNDWGFQNTPFSTDPLSPDEVGESLLVGRDSEIGRLRKRILNPPKLATVEGQNGVGKTSLINVAVYQLMRESAETQSRRLFLPCVKRFQLTASTTVETFKRDVILGAAQTILVYQDIIESSGLDLPDVDAIDKWINTSLFKSGGARASIGVADVGNVGVGASKVTAPNTSEGFTSAGMERQIESWLSTTFPSPDTGGIVAIIDNLELLQTSTSAKRKFEELRDPVLSIPGIRWVLAGSSGITYGVAASPRMEGRLHTPIEVGSLPDDTGGMILSSRIKGYAISPDSAYLPLTSESFKELYDILHGNLRSSLSYADNYCMWASDLESLPDSGEDKDLLFQSWLKDTATEVYDAVGAQLRPRAWQTFRRAIEIGGSFSPGQYKEFGLNSIPALRPSVRDLEGVGILQSTEDESDRRRRTISVLPKGWLLAHADRLIENY